MIEFITGAFLVGMSFWLTWPVLLIAFIIAIVVLDDDWKVWSGIFVVVYSLSIMKFFEIPWFYFQFYLYAYVPIGLVWSMHRYRQYLIVLREKYNEYLVNDDQLKMKTYKKKINEISESFGKLVFWCYAWPINIVTWMMRDFVQLLKRLITVHLRGVYEKIQKDFLVD